MDRRRGRDTSLSEPPTIIPVEWFAYKRTGEEERDNIVFGMRLPSGPQWFSLTPELARQMGRALLAAGGKKAVEADYFLDTYRAARIDCRLGGLSTEEAARKRGVDVDILTLFMAKLDGANSSA